MLDFSISKKHHELARKTVHITFAATFVGLYYFFGSAPTAIVAFCAAIGLLFLHSAQIFKPLKQKVSALYDVGRLSWGEVLYAFAVGIIAIIAHDIGEFMTLLAIVAFADSAASLVGQSISSPKITFFGATATVAGSSAFFMVAMLVMVVANAIAQFGLTLETILLTAVVLTTVEAASPYGADNLLVPVLGWMMLFL